MILQRLVLPVAIDLTPPVTTGQTSLAQVAFGEQGEAKVTPTGEAVQVVVGRLANWTAWTSARDGLVAETAGVRRVDGHRGRCADA